MGAEADADGAADCTEALAAFHFDSGSEVGDARGVAGVGNGEGDGVFHPVVPDAIAIVGGGGEGVFLGTEGALEAEDHRAFIAWGAGAEGDLFQLGVGAEDFEADAGADHDADDGVVDGRGVADADADGDGLAALPEDGGAGIGVEGFDGEEFGAAVTAAEGGGEFDLLLGGPGAEGFHGGALGGGEDFLGRAAHGEFAGVDPPEFVTEGGEQAGFVGAEEDGGAGAALAFEVGGLAGAFGPGGIGEQAREGEDVFGFDGSGGGLATAGGEIENRLNRRGILADEAYDGSRGHFGRQGREAFHGNVTESQSHER